MKNTIITLASLATLLSSANAYTIFNGGFEDVTGLTGPQGGSAIYRGATLSGWTWTPVNVGGEIDLIPYTGAGSPTANAGSGTYYLETALLGSHGVLSQTIFGFTIGQQYELTFDWGNRIGSNPATSSYDFTVAIDGQSFSQSAVNGTQIGMLQETIAFTASATSATLSLDLKDTNTYTNGAFDNFVITPVPEPSSSALLGLGALGLLIRRKR